MRIIILMMMIMIVMVMMTRWASCSPPRARPTQRRGSRVSRPRWRRRGPGATWGGSRSCSPPSSR
jgi:hypothetical protein